MDGGREGKRILKKELVGVIRNIFLKTETTIVGDRMLLAVIGACELC